jgi:Rod binding domain-containing protein
MTAPVSSTRLATATATKLQTDRGKPDPRQAQAARDFEAVFLRQMLAPMEKAGKVDKEGAGSGMYGQMIVGALADAMAASGGIGLAKELCRAIVPTGGAAMEVPTNSSQGSRPGAVPSDERRGVRRAGPGTQRD